MRIGIIGAGNIGGNCAQRFIVSGKHEVKLSFSRDPANLAELARELGDRASVGTPLEAVRFGEVVVLSVPWDAIPEALRQAGSLAGKIVIDTTNQFGSRALPPKGQTCRIQRCTYARRPVYEVIQYLDRAFSKGDRRSSEGAEGRAADLWR